MLRSQGGTRQIEPRYPAAKVAVLVPFRFAPWFERPGASNFSTTSHPSEERPFTFGTFSSLVGEPLNHDEISRTATWLSSEHLYATSSFRPFSEEVRGRFDRSGLRDGETYRVYDGLCRIRPKRPYPRNSPLVDETPWEAHLHRRRAGIGEHPCHALTFPAFRLREQCVRFQLSICSSGAIPSVSLYRPAIASCPHVKPVNDHR